MLVTGASGFIGARVCRLLEQQAVRYVGVLGPRTPTPTSGSDPDTFVRAELTDAGVVRELVRWARPTRIINLAAAGVRPTVPERVEQYVRLNVQLPLVLAESMEESCTLVQVGSMSQYRGSPGPLHEDNADPDSSTMYAWTKNAAESGLRALAHAQQGRTVRCILARVFGVIGPGEAAHRLLPTILAGCRSGDDILLSDGAQIRDVLHVDDVASALVHLSLRGEQLSGEAVNVGAGEGRTVRWVAEKAIALLECGSSLRFGARPRRTGEADSLIADIAKLRSTGWQPRWGIDDAVARALRDMAAAPGIRE